MERYSVLMSVYAKEHPEYLLQSAQSMLMQTSPPDEFILVCDGPLTDELDAVVASLSERCGEMLRVVRMEKNLGLGGALNVGLSACKNELIARMDSDDISVGNRCALQLAEFAQEPELAIVGGAVTEFEGDPSCFFSLRKPPERQKDIIKYARLRNPFNHPSVMYRKSAVLQAGGYREALLHEDYDLWVRMLKQGAQVRNLPQTLVYMRIDSGLYDRRGGASYINAMTQFHRRLYKEHFCSYGEYVISAAAYRLSSFIPASARKCLYRGLLRG